MGPGQLAGNLVAISQVSIRYPWTDLNADRTVQPNEVNTSVTHLNKSAAFDPANPTSFRSPGRVDPDVKNDRTREFILGFQQEVMRNLGLEVNYVWRKYDQFQWSDRDNWSPANFQEFTLNPACTGNAVCVGPITYFRPTSTQPSPFQYTNIPDRYRNYNGIELAMTKRFSDRWMATASFAYNDAKDYWDSEAAFEDPTNIRNLSGYEFAPESGGSGIDNIFNNAKWLTKASGMYTLPLWDINLGANVQYRQGYPFPIAVTVTSRGGGVGDTTILQEPMGERRLENLFYADFKVDRAFTFGQVRVIPSMEVFNLGNTNTILARRRVMYTYNATTGAASTPANANNISGIVAPRVIRFGVRVQW
jgi:hypothetical protein